uniref:Uncharacterized protein n=1 Tax=viral metagenome TaxID=1070528 RepID=A0A6C0EPH4_9ZZZZ
MYSMQIKVLGLTCRIEIIAISIIVGMILGGHVLCSCITPEAKEKAKEGFVNALGSAPTNYKMGRGVKSSWDTKQLPSIAQDLSTHLGPKVPLPAGQLFFFANNKFSPDCCVPPQTGVSNSDGCACVTQEQVNYISSRGGNRAVYGEF